MPPPMILIVIRDLCAALGSQFSAFEAVYRQRATNLRDRAHSGRGSRRTWPGNYG